jgi:hypothetical protein
LFFEVFAFSAHTHFVVYSLVDLHSVGGNHSVIAPMHRNSDANTITKSKTSQMLTQQGFPKIQQTTFGHDFSVTFVSPLHRWSYVKHTTELFVISFCASTHVRNL